MITRSQDYYENNRPKQRNSKPALFLNRYAVGYCHGGGETKNSHGLDHDRTCAMHLTGQDLDA